MILCYPVFVAASSSRAGYTEAGYSLTFGLLAGSVPMLVCGIALSISMARR